MHLSRPVAKAAVHSKAVVLLLLIYCLMYFPLFVGVLRLSLLGYAFLCVHFSKAVVLLLLIYCFNVLPIVGGSSAVVFVRLCITLCPF